MKNSIAIASPMTGTSAKRSLILTVVVGASIAGGLVFLLLRWQTSGLEEGHTQVEQLTKELDKLQEEERSFTQARSDYQRIRQRAADIGELFPRREGLVEQVKRLEQAAVQSGDAFSLTIQDVSEQPGASPAAGEEKAYTIVPELKQLDVIPYEFKLDGSFLSIIHFLQILEHQPFYSELEALTLSSTSVSGDGTGRGGVLKRSGQVQATIRSAFYARKSPMQKLSP